MYTWAGLRAHSFLSSFPLLPRFLAAQSLLSPTGSGGCPPAISSPHSCLSLPLLSSHNLSHSLSCHLVFSLSLFLHGGPPRFEQPVAYWQAHSGALRPEHTERAWASSICCETLSLAAMEVRDGQQWKQYSNASKHQFFTRSLVPSCLAQLSLQDGTLYS